MYDLLYYISMYDLRIEYQYFLVLFASAFILPVGFFQISY